MFRSTREFVEALERAGELVRITAPASPILEIGCVADVVSKAAAPHGPSASARRSDPRCFGLGGPALLFERVEPPGADGTVRTSSMPLLINGWGSYRRLELALGCHDEDHGLEPPHTAGGFAGVGARIAALVKPEPPRSVRDAIAKARAFAPLLKIGPRRLGSGACQEVVYEGEAIDLTSLPIIRCWPLDGDLGGLGYPPEANAPASAADPGVTPQAEHVRGRYITLAGVHTIHADDRGAAKASSHNIGMYRVQLLGPRRLAMHWHMHHDGAGHWRSWKRAGERMPVAIALGGESVLPYAATAPLPPGVSELLMAGFLNRGGIPLTRARSVPLWVPANADIVIEGWVSTEAGVIGWDPRSASGPLGPGAVFEGPFGDHTGFYSLPDRYPIVEVTAVTMRRDPIYPTTIVGPPPQEDYYLGKATERVFLPLLKTLIHDVEDYDLPLFGAFHNCAVIQIRKAYPLQGRRVMHAVWGAGQMAWTKCVFVVDESVDPHDLREVLAACARWCRADRDLEVVNGPLDILDHAAPRLGAGGKIGFDCTPKHADEDVGGVPVLEDAAPAGPPSRAALEGLRAIDGVLEVGAPAASPGWVFLRVDGARRSPREVLREAAGVVDEDGGPAFVVAVGAGVDVADADAALFHWAANMDPSRDLVRGDGGPGVIGFDSTPKTPGEVIDGRPVRDWPPALEMDEATRARVRARWAEFGIRGIAAPLDGSADGSHAQRGSGRSVESSVP